MGENCEPHTIIMLSSCDLDIRALTIYARFVPAGAVSLALTVTALDDKRFMKMSYATCA